jgi:hypothetical protein
MLKNKKWTSGLSCFYCGVDSTELKLFLFAVIGGLVLSSVFVFIAAYSKGFFHKPESIKHKIFEQEERN